MILLLGLSSPFESQVMSASATFYADYFAKQLSLCQNEPENTALIQQYLRQIELKLQEEASRVSEYLLDSLQAPLANCILLESLKKHLQAVLSLSINYLTLGFFKLCDNMLLQDISKLNNFICQIDMQDSMKDYLRKYISFRTNELMNNEKELITSILFFKAKIDIIHNAMDKQESYASCIKEAFENSINDRGTRPSELLARFVNEKLKKGAVGTNEEELSVLLDKCIVIFRYMKGKDVFEAFYKVYLSKRLLLGKIDSMELERSMMNKLKTECGPGYTIKMEGMLKDIEASKEFNFSFKNSSKYTKSCGSIDFACNVLTNGYWPSFPSCSIKLPLSLTKCANSFEKYYLSKFSGRKLTWLHSFSSCIVKASFSGGTKELVVTVVQAMILELFNSKIAISFEEIKEELGLNEEDLKKELSPLCHEKLQILLKESIDPNGSSSKHAMSNSSFKINDNFSCKQFRVKVNSYEWHETPEEAIATNEKVFQDRQYEIDAAIVRLMKNAKCQSQSELLQQLFEVLKFPATSADLKKRIESLIERDFIERDKSDSKLLHYVI